MSLRHILRVLPALVAVACSSEPPGSGANPIPADAVQDLDAGSGEPSDTTPDPGARPDAGRPDAGARPDASTTCQPSCRGKRCGDDGCGGSCGACRSGQQCSLGACVSTCQPSCAGKLCGDDGCGGTCGSCGASETCKAGACVAANYCVSSDVYLADDYCSTGCCPGASNHIYAWGGIGGRGSNRFMCACTASCLSPTSGGTSFLCRVNGDCCAGSHCAVNLTPGAHTYGLGFCEADPGTSCTSKACTASGAAGGCCQWTPYCGGSDGCRAYRGSRDDRCADDGACEAGLTCVAGRCKAPCTPSCNGSQCGSDGCGGTCGTCASGETCSSGTCRAACVPSCAGRTCGSNGCGGSCGTCGSGEACSGGNCVALACDPVGNTGCPAGEGCWLLGSGQPTCGAPGAGTQGSSCATTASCAGGHACFAGTCRKICTVSSGAGCGSTQTCRGVSGWGSYGACN